MAQESRHMPLSAVDGCLMIHGKESLGDEEVRSRSRHPFGAEAATGYNTLSRRVMKILILQ
jgi:hypothetical protein